VQQECSVNDEGVIALGRALEVNKTLQYLNLVSCRVVVFVVLFAGDAASRAVCFGLFSSVFNVPGKSFDVSL
jgi:hypothetical protein